MTEQAPPEPGATHVAGQVTFLVCVADDGHSEVAARFAALRARNSGGMSRCFTSCSRRSFSIGQPSAS